MSITDSFPMRKRRSVDKTPGRSTSNSNGGRNVQCTPRRITSNNAFLEQGLEIVWDNHSPSPTRTLHLGKRKKKPGGSDSSSSGGEISDLVKRLADKTGQTPESNSLLKYWMQREDQSSNVESKETGNICKKKTFQTPASRRPRRGLRRGNRGNVKQLTKELEILASQMQHTEPDKASELQEKTSSSTIASVDTTNHQLSTKSFEDFIPAVQRKPLNTFPNGHNNRLQSTAAKQAGLMSTNIVLSPVRIAPDLEDFDWDDDEDVILSQVDISALCEADTQVFSNTQLLDSGGKREFTADTTLNGVDGNGGESTANELDDSFVTESWDFTDDLGDEDSILLSTLQEVEQSQQIKPANTATMAKQLTCLDKNYVLTTAKQESPKYSKTTAAVHNVKTSSSTFTGKTVKTSSSTFSGKTSSSTFSGKTVKTSSSTFSGKTSSSTFSGKTLKTSSSTFSGKTTNSNYKMQNNMIASEATKAASSTGGAQSKPKYSLEDIEKKKLEALQRRKMKQVTSQKTQNYRQSKRF